jgi:hypothetical protein
MDTTLEAPRQFVPGRRGNLRVVVNRKISPNEDLDTLIERLRCDVFDLYTVVREAQRERSLDTEARLRMLGEAAATARYIADTIDRRRAAAVFDLEPAEAFGVPI